MRWRRWPWKGLAVLLCAFAPHTGTSGARAADAPEQVGTGVVSTIDDESGFVLAPDGASAFFTKRSPTTNTPPRSVICVTRRINGRWGEPQIAPFSGRYNDFGVAISVGGRRIVFSSDRPNPAFADAAPNVDLWIVDRQGDAWSTPRNLGAPVNTPANEAYPSLAADGTLYFASTRPNGRGAADIYRARRVEGGYAQAENLADINSPGYDSQPAVAPDQSFLVFSANDRGDALSGGGAPYPRTDLYVSFRRGDGWTAPRNLGPAINSSASESTPSISADGREFFFASDRGFATVPMPRRLDAHEFDAALRSVNNGWSNIYRLPVSAIESRREPMETLQP